MLTTQRNGSRTATSHHDVVHEARQWRNTANEKGSNGSPIGCKFFMVAIDAVEVVHIWDRHITASDNVVTVKQEELAR